MTPRAARRPERASVEQLPAIDRESKLAVDYAHALAHDDQTRLVALRRQIEQIVPDPRRAAGIRAALSKCLTAHRSDTLPMIRGVYLIGGEQLFSERGSACYVGLSANIHSRFIDGHWRWGGTRADVLSEDEQVVYAAKVHECDLVTAEVLLYILARLAGLNPNNSVGHLGMLGQRAPVPVVACRISDGRLSLHESAAAASRDLQIRYSISAVLSGYQNAAGGYTFRLATTAEAAAGTAISRKSDACFDGRMFRWSRGGVNAGFRSRFVRTSSYARQVGGYHGVTRSDRAPGLWTARLVDLTDQPNNPSIIVGRRFTSAQEAHQSRERYLKKHPELRHCNRSGLRARVLVSGGPDDAGDQ